MISDNIPQPIYTRSRLVYVIKDIIDYKKSSCGYYLLVLYDGEISLRNIMNGKHGQNLITHVLLTNVLQK